MAYINVGAYVEGSRPRTKKALREALATTPETVTFDQTSMFDSLYPVRINGTEVPAGVTLTVFGPDPYRDRKWYASVTVDGTGKVRVK